MTSRERVLTAFNREPPDRVPTVLYGELVGYVPSVAKMLEEKCGGTSPLEYFGFDITSFSLAASRNKQDSGSYMPVDEHTTVDEWGVGWKGGSHLHYAEIVHSLQNLSLKEIREYPFPDFQVR